jgi:hypothetical protein
VNTLAARQRAAAGRLPLFGALALTCFVVHASYHVLHGRPHDALWVCHVAALSIALGCFIGQPSFVAVGVLWLSFGNPLWVTELLTGGEFLPTSILTHVVAFVVGIVAVRKLGWPRAAWGKATIALLPLLGLTRLVTPPPANVNLAFGVAGGWEKTFPSHGVYLLLLYGSAALTFFLAELGWRRPVSPKGSGRKYEQAARRMRP